MRMKIKYYVPEIESTPIYHLSMILLGHKENLNKSPT